MRLRELAAVALLAIPLAGHKSEIPVCTPGFLAEATAEIRGAVTTLIRDGNTEPDAETEAMAENLATSCASPCSQDEMEGRIIGITDVVIDGSNKRADELPQELRSHCGTPIPKQ